MRAGKFGVGPGQDVWFNLLVRQTGTAALFLLRNRQARVIHPLRLPIGEWPCNVATPHEQQRDRQENSAHLVCSLPLGNCGRFARSPSIIIDHGVIVGARPAENPPPLRRFFSGTSAKSLLPAKSALLDSVPEPVPG